MSREREGANWLSIGIALEERRRSSGNYSEIVCVICRNLSGYTPGKRRLRERERSEQNKTSK